jgi:hypothetical protein
LNQQIYGRAGVKTPRTAGVTAERRDALTTLAPVPSSRPDDGEHGVRLPAVGTQSCGALTRLISPEKNKIEDCAAEKGVALGRSNYGEETQTIDRACR